MKSPPRAKSYPSISPVSKHSESFHLAVIITNDYVEVGFIKSLPAGLWAIVVVPTAIIDYILSVPSKIRAREVYSAMALK
jgi:hypothetical protein